MNEQNVICPTCGSNIGNQAFCYNCGTPAPAPAAPVMEQPAAPAYQQPVYQEPAYQQPAYQQPQQPAYQQPAYGQPQQTGYGQPYNQTGVYDPNAAKDDSKKKIFVVIGAAVAALILLIIIISSINKGPNFKSLYNDYCSYPWATYGSDYLSIDTNPYDYDDCGCDYVEGVDAIERINRELGLPSWFYDDIMETCGLDGTRTEYFKDAGVSVTWSYHPDDGLEVTYRTYK